MEKIFYLTLFWVVCQLNVTTSGAKKGKLTFIAVGDFGGSSVPPYTTYTQKRLAKVMSYRLSRSFGTRFLIGLGDNFYLNGVRNVSDSRFCKTFEEVYKQPILRAAKWYMIAGNHDHYGNVSAQIAYSKVSPRWHFPHFYYSVVEKIPGTSSTVQLVMIDTTLLCFKSYRHSYSGPGSREQLQWIRQTLQSSTADYLLVNGHHPVFSAGWHGSTPCLQNELQPLLEEYKVTAYLCGHDHNLQYIKTKDSGVHYIVTGSGNFYNSLSWNKIHLPMKSRALKYFYGHSGAFTLLEATEKKLRLTMIDEYDRELHRIILRPRQWQLNSEDRASSRSVLDDFFNLQSLYNTSTADDYDLDNNGNY